MTERVSPTERIRAQIHELFAGVGDLGETLEEVARLGARLLLQSALEAEVPTRCLALVVRGKMSSQPHKDKLLESDLFRGIGLTFAVLGALLLVGAILHVTAMAEGVWFVWLFITQKIWIDPLVRFLYRRRWTKIFLWPLSRGDQESCASILRALTWAYLFIGGLLILIEINYRAAN